MTQGKKFRIIIAEDHTLFRQGIKSLLSLEQDFEVVGEAEDGATAIRCVERLKPDLILLDLSMPGVDGLTAIEEIRKKYSKTKILILTGHKTEEFFREALKCGAHGYVLKEADHSELLLAMRSVLEEKSYLSPDVSRSIINGYLSKAVGRGTDPSDLPLTTRERQILKLVAKGHKNKDIADQLCISDKTVAKHRANIMKKLNLRSASALTAYAIEKGLI
jgi:DNA-binding NarL/FixJ family response regulator